MPLPANALTNGCFLSVNAPLVGLGGGAGRGGSDGAAGAGFAAGSGIGGLDVTGVDAGDDVEGAAAAAVEAGGEVEEAAGAGGAGGGGDPKNGMSGLVGSCTVTPATVTEPPPAVVWSPEPWVVVLIENAGQAKPAGPES